MLCLDRSPAGELPSSHQLMRWLRSSLSGYDVTPLERRDDDQGCLALVRVTRPHRRARPTTLMLGARRMRGEVLLCRTRPDASAAELAEATRVYRELHAV